MKKAFLVGDESTEQSPLIRVRFKLAKLECNHNMEQKLLCGNLKLLGSVNTMMGRKQWPTPLASYNPFSLANEINKFYNWFDTFRSVKSRQNVICCACHLYLVVL